MTKPEYYDGVLNSLKQRQDHDSILASQIIESQQKRIGELERDKARLDWIAKEKPNMLCLCIFDSQGAPKSNGYVWEINDFHTDEDLRVAIDKAKAALKGSG